MEGTEVFSGVNTGKRMFEVELLVKERSKKIEQLRQQRHPSREQMKDGRDGPNLYALR